jgi:tetratricopeptide (TPR) repeat protein
MNAVKVKSAAALLAVAGLLAATLAVSCAATPAPAESPAATGALPQEYAGQSPSAAQAPEVPPGAEEILGKAVKFLDAGDYEAALALFGTIEEETRALPEIRLLEASVLLSAGRIAEARALTGEALAAAPDSEDGLFILAVIEQAAGNRAAQKAALERLVAINPRHGEALAALGSIALAARSYQTAASYFDRALAIDPGKAEALAGRAELYLRSKLPVQAKELLSRAIRLYPDWTAPLILRARIYRDENDRVKALSDLDAAKALDPRDFWVLYDRGRTLLDLGRREEALEDFDLAESLDKSNYLVYAYRGGLRDDLGDYPGAEADYRRLLALKPDYFYAWESIGVIKMRQQQWAAARDAFLKTYNAAPSNPTYALLAALNWFKAGGGRDLQQFLAKAMAAAPRDSIDYTMLRLYREQSGDSAAAAKIDKETNIDRKARMLYYLAEYYAINKKDALANRYFMEMKALSRWGILEWKLNEIEIEMRNLQEK